MTHLWSRLPRHLLIRIGYLAAGVTIGALWLAQGDKSPWHHALRLLVLMAVIMSMAEVVRRLAARRGRHVAHHPIGRFLLVKLTLVVLAVTADVVLGQWLSDVDLWVGIGMAVVVTVAGPALHSWLVQTDAAGPDRTKPAAVAPSPSSASHAMDPTCRAWREDLAQPGQRSE